jgi:hypothetical protein
MHPPFPIPVPWVCFDVGETLIDETRLWAGWADWLGVTHLTFCAALGAIIAQRRDHREVFSLLRPGFDLAQARVARAATGQPEGVDDRRTDDDQQREDWLIKVATVLPQAQSAGTVVALTRAPNGKAVSDITGLRVIDIDGRRRPVGTEGLQPV